MTGSRLPDPPQGALIKYPELADYLAEMTRVTQGELDRLRATYQRLQDPAALPYVTVAQLNTSANGSSFYRNVSAGRMVWVTDLAGGAGPAMCNASGVWKTIALVSNVS